MKELLQQYAAYNIWANNILFERINKLSSGQINETIASSFSSIYKTTAHMWLAEEAWWKRMNLFESIVLESAAFTGSFSDLCNHLAKQSQQWATWVDNATVTELNHAFYYMRNNEQYSVAVKDMLLHLFNHATYHRGQLVTLLRQLGEDNIPATDFVAYCRTKI